MRCLILRHWMRPGHVFRQLLEYASAMAEPATARVMAGTGATFGCTKKSSADGGDFMKRGSSRWSARGCSRQAARRGRPWSESPRPQRAPRAIRAYRDLVTTMTMEAASSTPEQFQAFVREEIARYGEVARRLDLRIE